MNPSFTELNPGDLAEVDGGTFAYDVGRSVRFLFIGARSVVTNPTAAIVDWYGNSLL